MEWRTIPALPDVLLNRLCELTGVSKATETRPMTEDAKEGTGVLDRFLTYYDVGTLGDWFPKGKSWLRPIECPRQSEPSTCVVYTEGGGYGFDCKHRCANKGFPW